VNQSASTKTASVKTTAPNRRLSAQPLHIEIETQPDFVANYIDALAEDGHNQVKISLEHMSTFDFSTLQLLLAAREYSIRRGLVMRLVDVTKDMTERIRWADAGRLLEDDLMLV
jgi:anti-anti-sigma regulatory factor